MRALSGIPAVTGVYGEKGIELCVQYFGHPLDPKAVQFASFGIGNAAVAALFKQLDLAFVNPKRNRAA